MEIRIHVDDYDIDKIAKDKGLPRNEVIKEIIIIVKHEQEFLTVEY